MAKVTRVDQKIGAYCALLEYKGLEGLVMSSELSKKRIKSIRQVIGVGKEEVLVVLRVDKAKGYVDLSKKRVEPDERQICRDRFTTAKNLHSMLCRVSLQTRLPLSLLYQNLLWPLYEQAEAEREQLQQGDDDEGDKEGNGDADSESEENKPLFTNPLEAFQLALHDQDLAFGALEMPEYVKQALMSVIRHRLRIKPLRVRAKVELVCFSKHGVNGIKKALSVLKPLVVTEPLAAKQKGKDKPKEKARGKKGGDSDKKSAPQQPKAKTEQDKKQVVVADNGKEKQQAEAADQAEEENKAPSLLFDVSIHASPIYLLTAVSVDKEAALKIVNEAIKLLGEELSANGGQMTLIQAPTIKAI
jgi:translation initiation factor 2 alpha subunit (eIF-2alpha)